MKDVYFSKNGYIKVLYGLLEEDLGYIGQFNGDLVFFKLSKVIDSQIKPLIDCKLIKEALDLKLNLTSDSIIKESREIKADYTLGEHVVDVNNMFSEDGYLICSKGYIGKKDKDVFWHPSISKSNNKLEPIIDCILLKKAYEFSSYIKNFKNKGDVKDGVLYSQCCNL